MKSNWWQKALQVVSVSGALAGGAAFYRSAWSAGERDAEIRQMRTDIDRLRVEHEWLVKTLFRLPVMPSQAGGAP